MKLQNIVNIISAILGIVGVIFLLRIMGTGDEQIEKFNNHSSTTKGTIRLTLEKNHK